SNLNRGSAHDTFAAGGLAFAIDPDSRQTAGTGMTIGASAYNSFTLGKEQSLVASAGADLTTDLDGTSAEQVSLRAGLSWHGRIGGSRFALGPVADVTYLASQPHLWRSGLSGRLEVPVGTQNLVALSFTALTQDYASQSYRNGIRVLAAGAITHALTPAMRARFQVGMDLERTRLAHLDHDGAHAELRLANEWPGGFSTSALASYARVQHRGDFPGTASPRADDRLTAGVTASNSQIDLGGFTPE